MEAVTFDDMDGLNQRLSFLDLNHAALGPLLAVAVERAAEAGALSEEARQMADVVLAWDGVRRDADGDGYVDDLAEPMFEAWCTALRDELFAG